MLRVGIIGTGFWAVHTHGPVLAEHPQAELVGIWGRRPEATAAAADSLHTRGFDGLNEMLDAVDAVVLTVPPTAQADLAVACAAAGKHLLLEKPLALDTGGAGRIVDAVQNAGVAALVFFTSRHRPEQAGWIAAAQRREWVTARATWTASLFKPDFEPDPTNWRHTAGALWDVGPHALSVALGVLGDAIEVSATAGTGDMVHLIVQHRSGATSMATLSLTAPPAAGESLFTAYGESGILNMPVPLSTPQEAAACAISDLAEMVRTGVRDHPADVSLGFQVTRTLAAAQEALSTGVRVRLD